MTKVEYEFRKKYYEAMKLPFDFDLTKDQEIIDMFVHFANGWCVNKAYTEKLIKEGIKLKEIIVKMQECIDEYFDGGNDYGDDLAILIEKQYKGIIDELKNEHN